jgi:prepilin-type N-terminal cleavage/methylation domain
MERSPRGFSLLEMIVSVGLFAIVMLVSTGAYLSLISLDRKARATNDLVTNLSFAIDTMERSLRTGTAYACGGIGQGPNCVPGNTSLAFVDDEGQTITYKQSGTAIQQCIGLSCSSLTDPRITVQSMKFYVRGVGTSGTDAIQQPWVVFVVKGTITPDSNSGPITFTIQSTASQRAIDL